MNKQKAHKILDAARAGLPVSDDEITEALIATGDLCSRPVSTAQPIHPLPSALNRCGPRVMRDIGEVRH